MNRYRVEFSNGARITVKANTEAEAYVMVDMMSNYAIVEIWRD